MFYIFTIIAIILSAHMIMTSPKKLPLKEGFYGAITMCFGVLLDFVVMIAIG